MLVRDHWHLNPDINFLNHGSFGACPKVVLEKQHALIRQLEQDPIRFLAPERDLLPKLDEARQSIGELTKAPSTDIVFVRNATDGVNAVLSSYPFKKDDEILITNHGYNACKNAAHHAAEKTAAKVTVANVPFPLASKADVVHAIKEQVSSRTRVLLVDHVTSPTGLIFPMEEIIAFAHSQDIQVLVDGAHAPGMLPLDLTNLSPDYYTGNHHKWLCAPKASGFLYVKPELQTQVRPNVISHGANQPHANRSRFLTEFDWTGTYDPTPLLSVPAALQFMNSLYPGGLTELYQRNKEKTLVARKMLCDALEIDAPCNDEMIGSMASIPFKAERFSRLIDTAAPADNLRRVLFNDHGFELPIFSMRDTNNACLRVSMQAYNEISQIERLANVLIQLKG
jgi:isopenicillin-N epimerase